MTGKNETAWKQLDDKYGIAQVVESDKVFTLDVEQIREFREPRLLTKVDSQETQPEFLTENGLGILPLSRSRFLIARIDTFAKVPNMPDGAAVQVTVPDLVGLTSGPKSETTSVLRALHSGALSQFLGEDLQITTFGRMGTGSFKFGIDGVSYPIEVNGAQIEIDAGLESGRSLCLVEAKNRIPATFNLRQIYYPFRTWGNLSERTHEIRNVFMGVEGDELLLLEYRFEDPNVMTSSTVIKSERYQLMSSETKKFDVREATAAPLIPVDADDVPLPQADSASRILTIINLANDLGGFVSKDDVVDSEMFDVRQAGYYPNAAVYLGYFDRLPGGLFQLSQPGVKIAQRSTSAQIEDIKRRLCGDEFTRTAIIALLGRGDAKGAVEKAIRDSQRWGALSRSTVERRAQTFISWAKWVLRGADF
jgi:hypothetical protein